MLTQVAVPTAQLAEFCRGNQIRKLALFGSVLRDNFRSNSDIDVLVEFEPEARVNFFTFIDLQDCLSELFQRQVDLHTPKSLSHHIQTKVLDTAEVIYERARQDAFA